LVSIKQPLFRDQAIAKQCHGVSGDNPANLLLSGNEAGRVLGIAVTKGNWDKGSLALNIFGETLGECRNVWSGNDGK